MKSGVWISGFVALLMSAFSSYVVAGNCERENAEYLLVSPQEASYAFESLTFLRTIDSASDLESRLRMLDTSLENEKDRFNLYKNNPSPDENTKRAMLDNTVSLRLIALDQCLIRLRITELQGDTVRAEDASRLSENERIELNPGDKPDRNSKGKIDWSAPEVKDLNIVKVQLPGGCYLYDWAGNGDYLEDDIDAFSWRGPCLEGHPISGYGVWRRETTSFDGGVDRIEVSGLFRDGVLDGKATVLLFFHFNPPEHRLSIVDANFADGCDLAAEDFQWCEDAFSALQRVTRSPEQAQGKEVSDVYPEQKNTSQYDDLTHNSCISLQELPHHSTSAMAYGNYIINNSCDYSVSLTFCTAQDRADGTPVDDFQVVAETKRCSGGFGATVIRPKSQYKGKTWYTYNRIEMYYYACREGWTPVSSKTDKYVRFIDEHFRCRRSS
ncbi:hypothetical protein NCG89_10095 [Spongiibacter taiwanensis]|uniref:hypothetical protein n=1 Tax=Spongiibacter taiwanensis TaxID=1748242 RepID=UPI0020355B5B|nr:hypothetical protein [Spongiibacter taiwanensis]USA41869.1 hypothetical protein NCG89_10095 [Spongiibacter taiwanensis]